MTAQAMLEKAQWRTVSWRRGTKGRLSARFATVRVRVADGPPQRIRDMGAQHLPGEEVWVIGEHRSTGERKYYLSNLPADTPLQQIAGAIKARWVIGNMIVERTFEFGHERRPSSCGVPFSRVQPCPIEDVYVRNLIH